MTITRFIVRSFAAAAIVLVAVLPVGTRERTAQTPDPGVSIQSELARVRLQIVASVPEEERAPLLQRLERAEGALKAQRTYQAVYLLESAYDGAAAFAFAASTGVQSPNDFIRKWTALGAPKPHSGGPGRVPAAVDALAEAAEDRGPATYQASRPYAQDSGTQGGLYYLGESQAVMNYAAFVRARQWPAAGRRPAFRSIAAELAALEREMTTRYETMERANHPTYIRASAALKQARSLDDHKAVEGALFEYLLSRYLFAPLRGAAAAEATRERIDRARAMLPAGEDHSLAELFFQFAEEGVAGDNAELRRGTAAVIDDIVPAYLAAIAPSSSTVTSGVDAAVTITLVRWPFT
jgi:hypothetical protein